jgi:integrase
MTCVTFASRLVQRGVDLYAVQRLLGHKTSHMTQRYAHHSQEGLRYGVRVLRWVALTLVPGFVSYHNVVDLV